MGALRPKPTVAEPVQLAFGFATRPPATAAELRRARLQITESLHFLFTRVLRSVCGLDWSNPVERRALRSVVYRVLTELHAHEEIERRG